MTNGFGVNAPIFRYKPFMDKIITEGEEENNSELCTTNPILHRNCYRVRFEMPLHYYKPNGVSLAPLNGAIPSVSHLPRVTFDSEAFKRDTISMCIYTKYLP